MRTIFDETIDTLAFTYFVISPEVCIAYVMIHARINNAVHVKVLDALKMDIVMRCLKAGLEVSYGERLMQNKMRSGFPPSSFCSRYLSFLVLFFSRVSSRIKYCS